MADKPDIDFGRVGQLLSIVESVSKVGPGFTHITSEAMAELRQVNEDIRRYREVKQGLAPSPAPVGDVGSPAPIEGAESSKTNTALSAHPTATPPISSAVKNQTEIERKLYGTQEDPNTYFDASKFSNEGVPVTAPAESVSRAIPASSIAEKIRGN